MKIPDERKESIDIIIERYLPTSEHQKVNEAGNYHLEEQNDSTSAISLIRSKIPACQNDPLRLVGLAASLALAAASLGMPDGSRKAGLSSLAKIVATRV